MWIGRMILGKIECDPSYISAFGLREGIMTKLKEMSHIPVVSYLIKTKNLDKICDIRYSRLTCHYDVYWKIPVKDETLFWLKFANESGVEYIEDEI